MKYHTRSLALLLLALSCKDKDETPLAVGVPCEAEFTLSMPDGTIALLDECVHHGVNAEFVEGEAALPQPRVLSFIFRSSADTDVDCWVRWEQEGVCLDQPWHDLSRDTSEITWSTHNCAPSHTSWCVSPPGITGVAPTEV